MTSAKNYIDCLTVKLLGVSPAPAGTIIFPKIGAAIHTNKKRKLSCSSSYDNNIMGLIPSKCLISGFLFYWILTKDISNFANHSGALPSIRKSTMGEVKIPVPPLPVQQEIVSILDRFDALVNDFSSGLPAEIKARRQQYEYYRDKLLTFKEAS